MIETSMRAEVADVIDRHPEVVGPVRILRLGRLLRVVAGAREVAIAKPRGDTVADNGFHSRKTDEVFAAWMIGSPDNCIGGNLRLKDWRYRLRTPEQAALDPVELRRVQCRQLHHGDSDGAVVVQQLRAER